MYAYKEDALACDILAALLIIIACWIVEVLVLVELSITQLQIT